MPSRIALLTLLVAAGTASNLTGAQETADRIIFPHSFHIKDVGVECTDCHAAVTTSTALSHNILPDMDFCLDCHDGDTAPEECELCHTQPDDPGTYGWAPTAGLQFPHSTHLANGVACEKCHLGKAGAEALAPRMLPAMGLCMDCHNTPITDSGCLICHASLEGKRPANHAPDWREVHGLWAGGAGNNDCAMCHQETDCEACHAQAQLEKQVHPANYGFLHAGDFLSFEKECSTCHQQPRECMSCHLARAVMPLSHNSWGWVNVTPGDGGFHAEEALDKPDYCLVCHDPGTDYTCQKCHVN